ncbi:MAG: T9SS type A sorting domain-containing protein, partial [Bacteroidota bacterium]
TLPSAAGANVSVDYSAFTANGALQTQSFVSPAGTTFASTFPTATIASPVTSTQGNLGYSYYVGSASKVEMIGIGTNSYVMTFSNPSTVLSFPMSFNDFVLDTFKAEYTVNGILVKRNGTLATTADAHGTIKTPAGTTAYLRLKMSQIIVDSLFMSGTFMQTSVSSTLTYNYMYNGSSAPIFSYSEVTTPQGSNISAYYNTTITTGVSETKGSNLLGVSVYPNPAKNTVVLTADLATQEMVTIKVIDITGKEALYSVKQLMQQGNNEFPVDVTALASGLYSIVLQSESIGTKAVKFTVE